ncbi:hypothetical protein RIR_jg13489.t1 [Rhizophagus irregularis DAOM 181602=DAOM 197198]|nr:hypothetical protein RIR_jg13489.t1 [Rhizophagus irregularis DAOM 181602=DAOM 197198]
MFNKKRSELPTRLYNKNLWEFGKKKLIRNSKVGIMFHFIKGSGIKEFRKSDGSFDSGDWNSENREKKIFDDIRYELRGIRVRRE